LVAFDDQLVEVGGLGLVHGLECEVVDDEQFDAVQAAHLGLDAVVQPGGLQRPEQLVGAGKITLNRRRIATCPKAVARCALLTPTGRG
jgi:hypothetical protein